MKKGTILTKVGRNTKRDKGYINPPIYKGSTIVFDSFRKYLNDRDKVDDGHNSLYGIQYNPTAENFEKAISELYEAEDTVLTPSGLTALVIPFLTFLKKGDHVLISDALYNPTRNFVEKILKNFGIKINYFHALKDINKLNKKINIKDDKDKIERDPNSPFAVLEKLL